MTKSGGLAEAFALLGENRELVDHILLAALDPSGDGEEQQLQHESIHGSEASDVGTCSSPFMIPKPRAGLEMSA